MCSALSLSSISCHECVQLKLNPLQKQIYLDCVQLKLNRSSKKNIYSEIEGTINYTPRVRIL
jgi:hypothetical protein